MSPGNDENIEPAASAPNSKMRMKSVLRSHAPASPIAFLRRNGRDAVANIGTAKLITQIPRSPRIESALFTPPPISTAVANVIAPRKPAKASSVPITTSALSSASDGIITWKFVLNAEARPSEIPATGNSNHNAPSNERKYVPSCNMRPIIGERCAVTSGVLTMIRSAREMRGSLNLSVPSPSAPSLFTDTSETSPDPRSSSSSSFRPAAPAIASNTIALTINPIVPAASPCGSYDSDSSSFSEGCAIATTSSSTINPTEALTT